jgi:hypothetical protein
MTADRNHRPWYRPNVTGLKGKPEAPRKNPRKRKPK